MQDLEEIILQHYWKKCKQKYSILGMSIVCNVIYLILYPSTDFDITFMSYKVCVSALTRPVFHHKTSVHIYGNDLF